MHWHILEDDVKYKITKACAARKKRAERAARRQTQANNADQQMDLWSEDDA